jgi:hypothetical protein
MYDPYRRFRYETDPPPLSWMGAAILAITYFAICAAIAAVAVHFLFLYGG